ncbi:MAG: SDR family NAD(P)-dependent oxidoreductase [Pseudomonadales bacterium]|nr:SDR family NAD(P)-dependent oxidoreductase [Pseudomonadales bacterium]
MKRYELEGKVVAITGSTGGLGRATVKSLREKGARIALLDLDIETVEKQAADLGSPEVIIGRSMDVCSLESLETSFSEVAGHFGRIDIVIANAGLAHTTSVEATDPKYFEKVVDVNLTGVWRTMRAAIPYVKATRGYLMAVSSMAAFVHSPLNTGYTATKAGVWAMCDSLRLEVKQYGVDVGTIHPTFFSTPMMEANPCSELVWNNHKGIWKYVALDEVVRDLLDGIELRSDIVVVPKRNKWIASSPGLIRGLVERIGFDDRSIAKAVSLSATWSDESSLNS